MIWNRIIELEFYDKATQRDLGGASSDINYARVAPGGMQHFDIDTGYNITRELTRPSNYNRIDTPKVGTRHIVTLTDDGKHALHFLSHNQHNNGTG